MHGYLTNAARVNTPPLGAFQFPCPVACGGVIDLSMEAKLYNYGQKFADDQFGEIAARMKEAEGIVIGSPVYWHNMSGAVRNLLDRFYGPVSPGALSGRKCAFLFQGGAPEQWMLEKGEYTIGRFARMYGMEYIGMATNEKEAEKLAGKF